MQITREDVALGVQLVRMESSISPVFPESTHSVLQMLHKYSPHVSFQTPRGLWFAPRIVHIAHTRKQACHTHRSPQFSKSDAGLLLRELLLLTKATPTRLTLEGWSGALGL